MDNVTKSVELCRTTLEINVKNLRENSKRKSSTKKWPNFSIFPGPKFLFPLSTGHFKSLETSSQNIKKKKILMYSQWHSVACKMIPICFAVFVCFSCSIFLVHLQCHWNDSCCGYGNVVAKLCPFEHIQLFCTSFVHIFWAIFFPFLVATRAFSESVI